MFKGSTFFTFLNLFFMKSIRINEYLVFLYRIFLIYFFYTIARGLFIYFNHGMMGDYSTLKLLFYGLAFDNCAIMYLNLIFILMSLLPLWVNTYPQFQKIIFWVYFIPNIIGYASNFIDMAYYPFSKSRLTSASFAVIEHEQNGLLVSVLGLLLINCNLDIPLYPREG